MTREEKVRQRLQACIWPAETKYPPNRSEQYDLLRLVAPLLVMDLIIFLLWVRS